MGYSFMVSLAFIDAVALTVSRQLNQALPLVLQFGVRLARPYIPPLASYLTFSV
jgi:hypothetical protein